MKKIVFVFLSLVLLIGCKKTQDALIYEPFVDDKEISIHALEIYDGSKSSSYSITFNLGSSYSFDKEISSKDTNGKPVALSSIEGLDVIRITEDGENVSYSNKFFLKETITKGSRSAIIYFKNTEKTQETAAIEASLTIRVDKDILKSTKSQDEEGSQDYLDVGSFKFKVTKAKGSLAMNNGAILIPKIYKDSERIYEIAVDINKNAFIDIEKNIDFTEYFTLPESLADKGITFKTCIEGESDYGIWVDEGVEVVEDDEEEEGDRFAANNGDKRLFIAMKIPQSVDEISDVSNGLDKLQLNFPKNYLRFPEDLSCYNEIIFVKNEYDIQFILTPEVPGDSLDINGVAGQAIESKKMIVNIDGTYLSKPLNKGTDLTGLFYIPLQSINATIGRNKIACKVAENAPKLAKEFTIEFTGTPDKATTVPLYGNTMFANVDVYMPDNAEMSIIGVTGGEPYSEDITTDYPKIRIRGDAEISDYMAKYKIGDVVDDLRYTIKLYNQDYEFDSDTIYEDADVTENFKTGLLEGLSAKVISVEKSPSDTDVSEEIVVSIYGTVAGDAVNRGGSNMKTLSFQFNAKNKSSEWQVRPFLTSTNYFACLRLEADEPTHYDGEDDGEDNNTDDD